MECAPWLLEQLGPADTLNKVMLAHRTRHFIFLILKLNSMKIKKKKKSKDCTYDDFHKAALDVHKGKHTNKQAKKTQTTMTETLIDQWFSIQPILQVEIA